MNYFCKLAKYSLWSDNPSTVIFALEMGQAETGTVQLCHDISKWNYRRTETRCTWYEWMVQRNTSTFDDVLVQATGIYGVYQPVFW